ncbi:hypothetical protein E4Z66_02995 [Aliishimia ponticola]|uniref:Phytanoyl-CoA dioxygenase n=1 Tax=Aliishimia ponticola TaxID=2499833 RepID=A0A4S4NG01_9RHOB|nr:hypothetical protein [Aliishimia ponticola]THH38552.1 hypothetical protein E4Z66_02995 [Aliishimia ponticola]
MLDTLVKLGNKLRTDALAITDTETLGLDLSNLRAIRELEFEEKTPENDWDTAHHSQEMTGRQVLLEAPQIYQMGVGRQLMDVAEQYFGSPAILLDVTYRIDRNVKGDQRGVRRWHRDGESKSMLRAIVYLEAVGTSDGPFECLPKTRVPLRLLLRLLPRHLRHTDTGVGLFVRKSRWQKCTGPAGTVVLVDPAALYHHGTNPKAHREVVTFTYIPVGGG